MAGSKRIPSGLVLLLLLQAASPAEKPAATLKADALDAPAQTSLREAERAAELARGMAGHAGHAMGHGTPYRHVDAGREPGPSPAPTPPPAPHRHHEDGR